MFDKSNKKSIKEFVKTPIFPARQVCGEEEMINCQPEYIYDSKIVCRYMIIQHLSENKVKGDIIDLGCGSGANSFDFAKKNSHNRKIYAFDNFKGYTDFDIEESKEKFNPKIAQGLIDNEGRWDISSEIFQEKIDKSGLDIEIVKGDIQETTKNFKPKSGSISLLYIDCNTYGASISAINNLKQYFSDGALVFVDGGFCPPANFLDGEKTALLEYSKLENLPMFRTFFGNYASFFVRVM